MKFYFAWIKEEENFNPLIHARNDEVIFTLEISAHEGEYPTACVQIINPYCGLLYPERLQWAFIAID